ncbi:MAG: peptidoglycan-binding protein [Clostridia bacterium]|nr:peptidoglycan-binding protein [Clostridia bacterium]
MLSKHLRPICVILCLTLILGAAALADGFKLQRGDSGQDVYNLQNALKYLGYTVTLDGKYGYDTMNAVKSFQQDQGLTADGVAGKQTLARVSDLTGLTFPTVTSAPPSGGYDKLTPGMSGDAVRKMQQALIGLGYTLTADGRYGDTTRAAVTAFQRAQGLTADGIAGTATLTKLYALAGQISVPTAAPTVVPTVPAVIPAPADNGTAAQVTGGSLNLRAEPSINARVILSMPSGASVTVTQRGNTWSAVTYGQYSGWAMTQYLKIGGTAPTRAPAPVQPTQAPYSLDLQAVVTGGSLNLRAEPSVNARAYLSMPSGASVTITQYGNTWSAVTYGQYSGWAMTQYLKIGGTAPTRSPVTAAPTSAPVQPTRAPYSGAYSAVVTGGSLNLRVSPSTGARALLSMPSGAVVTVTQYGPEWCAVAYGQYSGYAMTRYLTIGGAAATPVPTQAPTPAPTQAPTPVPTWAPGPTAAPYDTSLFTRTLREGLSGQDVTALQTRLKALNYMTYVSGTYDTSTTAAVKQFQSLHGLTSDGVAGTRTLAALFSSGAVPYSSNTGSYTTLHIYYGTQNTSQKSAVQRMQERLQALGYENKTTGTFEETTYMAVVNFQLRNGLTVDGVASPAMQALLFSGNAKGMSAQPSLVLEDGAGVTALPDTANVKLLHWFNEVKPHLAGGSTLTVVDPATRIQFRLRVDSCGRHADCEPMTLRDTLLMFRALGRPSWDVHPVMVLLPDGRWTLATMHDRPHLTGTITANGFDGHLCVHFLRDMSECRQNDPDYGVTNQKTLRSYWQSLTGQQVD